MRNLKMILQNLLGIVFLIFGLNKFIGFIPLPEMSESATSYMMSLGSTKYMFPLIGLLEILCGVSLILNRYTTLSLLVLLPLTINIFGFHLFLDNGGILIPTIMLLVQTYLIYDRKDRYEDLIEK